LRDPGAYFRRPPNNKEIRVKRTLAALAAAALPALVLAQQQTPVDVTFSSLDKNRDGFVTRDEAKANKRIAKHFGAGDANKDGKLSPDEFTKSNELVQKDILRDSEITTKVKGEFLITKGIPSTAISVRTEESVVMLSGFVENKDQIAKAIEVAKSVSGVKSVRSALQVN
jgi:hyperosmotically inducible periplasmic protein